MKKSDIVRITAEYKLAPNKRLGQNFLINESVIERIVSLCGAEGRSILEIGPGLGSISVHLAGNARSYTAVEIDSGFVKYLNDLFSSSDFSGKSGSIKVIHGDFLKIELGDDFDLLVSNLPYYCASEILFRIAEKMSVPEILVMTQKEMAERIVSGPGSENYGALAVTLSYYFEPEILFHIAGESFYPRPEVKSSFLRLKRRVPYFSSNGDREMFHTVVKSVFWGRRKTILKSLTGSPHLKLERDRAEAILKRCGFSPEIRGEKLSVDEFIKLTEGVISDR